MDLNETFLNQLTVKKTIKYFTVHKCKLKVCNIIKVIKLFFPKSKLKIMEHYWQQFEYAMPNVRLERKSISSTAKLLTEYDT